MAATPPFMVPVNVVEAVPARVRTKSFRLTIVGLGLVAVVLVAARAGMVELRASCRVAPETLFNVTWAEEAAPLGRPLAVP